jgi:RNA 3'-terminal phosphate cyclase-like protein
VLAPFCKDPLTLRLFGVTNNNKDISTDLLRTVTIKLLNKFGIWGQSLQLNVKKRGAPPAGGGEVYFSCPIVKVLKPLGDLVDEGKIKRVRGVAFTAKCSQQIGLAMIDKVRGYFNTLLPDVFVYADHCKGKISGNSPGYALSLVCESTSGVVLSAECAFENDQALLHKSQNRSHHPEDVGERVSKLLLEEIEKGGCVDTLHQHIVLLLMILCPEDVSRVRLGALSLHTIECLRLYKLFFNTTFRIVSDNNTLLLSCRGVGFKNTARAAA